jgi:HK97 family phage prohead protease
MNNILIKGFASTFNNIDYHNDVIVESAYLDVVKRQSCLCIPICLEHNTGNVVGKLTRIYNKVNGLYIEGKLNNNLPKKYITMNASLSIGFFIIDSYIENGIRYITKIDLTEISIVQNPANNMAKATIYIG